MGTARFLACGLVAASIGAIAPVTLGAVEMVAPHGRVNGAYQDLTVVPPVYRAYLDSLDELPMSLSGGIEYGATRIFSSVSAVGKPSPESGLNKYSVVHGEGRASRSSVAGAYVECAALFQSNFAMTTPGWIELETSGLGVIEIRDTWRGVVYDRLSGDQTRRLYLESGFWGITASIDAGQGLVGEGRFRFVIPTSATGVLFGAGLSMLAAGRRRRC